MSKQYVLRWFDGVAKCEYHAEADDCLLQKTAKRFASAVIARSSRPAFTMFGAGGPDDTEGWKVVRLVKRRKEAT